MPALALQLPAMSANMSPDETPREGAAKALQERTHLESPVAAVPQGGRRFLEFT